MLYNPPAFRIDDTEAMHAHIAATGLAMLVTVGADGPLAAHLPLLLDQSIGAHGALIGHVARANSIWRDSDLTKPVLAIFPGPDAYVTPSWYPSKAEHGRVVPTWNYTVVHARGTLRLIDDKAELLGIVTRLTDRHERTRDKPWAVSDAPERYIESQLAAVVGLRLDITSLEGKAKLSQNRDARDCAGVVAGLAAEPSGGAEALHRLMQQ